jgi:hypothetical protein
VGASAQVLAHLNRLAGTRLAIAEGREQRLQMLAATAVLAAGDEGTEVGPTLGEQAIYFRAAIAGSLADLGVGVALGQQAQRPQLGRLQRLQCLAAAGDVLAPLDQLVGSVPPRGDQRHRVFGRFLAPALIAEQLLAALPHCQRLVLGHGLGPADQFA